MASSLPSDRDILTRIEDARVTHRLCRTVTVICIAGLAGLPIAPLAAQQRPTIRATRAEVAPTLDGRDDDTVWRSIPATSGFREARPTENGDPAERTTFKVAFDDAHLYVFVRAFDSSPDSIVGLLSRRDVSTASDMIMVMLDSYHDRRTGYEFVVNPRNVKFDAALYDDGEEDDAWDGVWDSATRVDSLGWTAEFRIPLSQVRFAPSDSLTFGFAIWRRLARHTADLTWPLYQQSQTGLVSQFADLTGLEGIASPKRAELIPYILTRNEPDYLGSIARRQRVTLGGDLKYAVTPNVTLTATVNPDFGQIEADPGELNLSAFETFFEERRPFFVAGAGLFNFRVNCFAVVDCSTGEALFYSRRIGRAPSLTAQHGDLHTATATPILGAVKLTGRMPGGLSFGLLDAVTNRVGGAHDLTVEPRTNFGVVRANQDFDQGNTSIGAMVTATHRDLDPASEPYLHQAAYSGGIDARRRFGRFELSGSLMASRVSGSAAAIARTQQRPAHYFQRPDDGVAFDPTRTTLDGSAAELRIGKVAGTHTRFESGYARRSSGFEINDIGFLNRANEQTWNNWFALFWNRPNRIYQRVQWNFNYWQYWSLDGLTTDRAFNTNSHTQFTNRWWLHLGVTAGLGQVSCDRDCTRGGPALRVEPALSPQVGVEGDNRHRVVPSFWVRYNRADGGRSEAITLSPAVTVKLGSQFVTSVSLDVTHNRDDSKWYGNVVDDGGVPHYTFAALDQHTVGLTWRLNYTFSPTMSFQWYANPFLSKGSYTRVRELADPQAARYIDRYQPWDDAPADAGGFNVKQFRSNAVFRWEYLPGSTLFVAWSQGREHAAPSAGTGRFGDDVGELFDQRADDRFMVKVSYWINK
jgi:hypothetical protein